MVELALAAAAMLGALVGSGVGLFAGLVPGLHANNISQATVAARAFVVGALGFAVAGSRWEASPAALFAGCGFLLGVSVGHSFTDEIPAVFLGAPDPDTALSVLPGHRLLQEGLGASAVRAAAVGTVLGIALSLPFVPVLAALLGPPGNLYDALRPFVPALLVAVALGLVLTEHGHDDRGLPRAQARALALGLLLTSGALGELVVFEGLSIPNGFPLGRALAAGQGHMLSLFAGLFGLPTLLLAARAAAAVPGAGGTAPRLQLPRRRILGLAALGTASGAMVGWLPGVGAAQAAVLAKLARDRTRPRAQRAFDEMESREAAAEFLVMQSAVAAANLVFSLVALFSLLRVRSGTMASLVQLGGDRVEAWTHPNDPPGLLVALLLATAATLPLCYAGALFLGGACATLYRKLPPRALAAGVFAAIVCLILAVEGFVGVGVAFVAITLGLVPPLAGVKRVHLMGAILVPVAARLLFAA